MLGGSSQPFNQSVCIGWSAADYTTQMRLKFMLPPEPSEGEGRELKCDFFSAAPLPLKDKPIENTMLLDLFLMEQKLLLKEDKKKKVML